MTCACVTMRARVHISVCGTQDGQDKTRQRGNHQNWGGGVAPRKSAPGIAIRAVQPALRPFSAFDAGHTDGAPHRVRTKSKWTRTGARAGATGGLPRFPRCLPCAPDRLRSVTDPDPGPLGAVRGRFGLFLAVFGPFGPILARPAGVPLPRFGPLRGGVGWSPGAKNRVLGRPPPGKSNPRVRALGQSRSRLLVVTCLLLVAC